MDISEKLKQMAEQSLENDKLSKNTTELSAKKYNLQKALKQLETTLAIKQDEFEKVKKQVILLSCEMPGWQEKERISKITLESLVCQVVEQEDKTSRTQRELWNGINEWVDRSSLYCQKIKTETGVDKGPDSEENERDEKIQQLKLEGQLEALRSFEKYQIRKIEEIRKIKNLVENVDTVEFFG